MKAVSSDYKNQIKEFGKEIDGIVTYTLNSVDYELGSETLNSISLHYEGNILKSVMKQLDLDSNSDIPIGTIINCQFGLKVDDEEYDEDDPTAYRINYEYIDLGNFIVYSSEKQEDNDSYKIVCYDKLLNSMKDYEAFATYPITIRNYISALCTQLGLTFANSSDTFPNYDKEIPNELYLDENGNTLNYTYRDVLDELAQVTASTICINDSDELELRYINDTQEELNEEYLKDVNVNFGEITEPINTITFKRSADSDVVSLSNPVDLQDDLKNEIVISDNQILNQNNRSDYLEDILDELYGLSYSINDFSSTGITYFELCDMYNMVVTKKDEDDNVISTTTYPCIMLNDDINIDDGLEEHIYTNLNEQTETDYNTTSKDDRTQTRATLIVDKAVGKITASVSKIEDIEETLEGYYQQTSDNTYQQGKNYYTYTNNDYQLYPQYSLTTDTTYQSGVDYYEYDDETDTYTLFTDYNVGDEITGEKYNQNYAIGDNITETLYELIDSASIEKRLSQAELTLTEQGATLETKTQKIDDNGNTTSFKTTNYTLDGNGFLIDDGSGYKSLSDTTGTYYYDSDDMIAKYTKDGSVQKDLAIFGKYYYGIDDETINVEDFTKDDAMFMAQLYEYNDGQGNTETGFGHFYNGS